MSSKKLIWIIGGLIAAGLIVGGFLYLRQSKPKESEKKGVVSTASDVSKSVPAIVTNPAEKVPEVNPLDRANPFKYVNPLR